jgi:hypothetical protein
MRANWLLLIIGAMLFVGAASATTVDCTTLTTLAAMQGQFTGGGFCQIGDVLITGLNTTNISGGEAALIAVSENNNPPTNANMSERGLNFNGEGTWGTGVTFAINFSGVLCYAGTPNCVSGVGTTFLAGPSTLLDEGQAAQTNPASSTVTTTNSVTPTGQSQLGLNANPGPSGAGSTSVVFYQGTTGFSMSLADNGQGNLNTIEGDVEEVVGPEPGTMLLMGGALLGLGMVSRKLRKKI